MHFFLKHFKSLRDAAAADSPGCSREDTCLAGMLVCHNTGSSWRGHSYQLKYLKENSRLNFISMLFYLSWHSYELVDDFFEEEVEEKNPVGILGRCSVNFCNGLKSATLWFSEYVVPHRQVFSSAHGHHTWMETHNHT